MKTVLQNTWLRSLCVLALGILLIIYSEKMPTWIVMTIGMLFIVPGSVAIAAWAVQKGEHRPSGFYPVVGLGSICFGLFLIITPESFVTLLMYLLSAVLLAFGASQCYSFWDIRRKGVPLHGICYLTPILTIAAGLYCLLRPAATAALPFLIIGAACILHALTDLCSVVVVWLSNRRQKAAAQANTPTVAEDKFVEWEEVKE